MSKELCYQSATDLAMMIKRKDISSLELTQAFIDRIEAVSYTHLTLPTIYSV